MEDKNMRWTWVSILLFSAIAFSANSRSEHRDYVPDKETAQRIAEAVLVGQYGEEHIRAQSPLLVDSSNNQYWLVQVSRAQKALPAKAAAPSSQHHKPP